VILISRNDAALDPEHWTGHTGCVILAPHLNSLSKKDLGLPSWDTATERQRRDGMCWKKADELYNDGGAFKITARDASGVVVTLISDNYFGYCKKEVKTQISSPRISSAVPRRARRRRDRFSELRPRRRFSAQHESPDVKHTFADALALLGERAELQPGGWARDKQFDTVRYVPPEARFDLRTQLIAWHDPAGVEQTLKLLPGYIYILPSGYKVEMANPKRAATGHLRGRPRKVCCVTNPAPFPAAANPRFQSPSPMRCSPARFCERSRPRPRGRGSHPRPRLSRTFPRSRAQPGARPTAP